MIPAPSGGESRRSLFCRKWLEAKGAEGVYLDEAGNVIYPYQVRHRSRLAVYMAHLDIAFPDEENLVIRQKERRLIGPGVGDDTANLVNLLMAAAFFAREKPQLDCGILFVADTGEEGLGNLKGCRQLMKDYGDRIVQMVSLDLYLGGFYPRSVGSLRYEVRLQAQGGHSFSDFGRESAIVQACQVVSALYQQKVPQRAKTTYNVGKMEGGTSVNAIAQEAVFWYEIRSLDGGCLEEMRQSFEAIIRAFQVKGMEITVRVAGERPCADAMEPEARKRQTLLERTVAAQIQEVTGTRPVEDAISSDANLPLARGIPAVTLGTILGDGAHTREEWVDMDSQRDGMKLVLSLLFALHKEDPGRLDPGFFSGRR